MMNTDLRVLYTVPIAWQILTDQIAEQLSENGGEIDDSIMSEIERLVSQGETAIEDAVLAKRNLELISDQAKVQSRVFQIEADRLKALSESWKNASQRIGTALVPVLELVGGKCQTVAGTAFLRSTPSYTFTLASGEIWELPIDCWKQPEPQLSKSALRERLKNNNLPEQISVYTTETVSVCLKRPTAKSETESTYQHGVAA